MSKSILVGVANVGERNIPMDVVESWNPDKISFLGDTVFFKADDKFLAMKKHDFCSIFKEKCAFIKY